MKRKNAAIALAILAAALYAVSSPISKLLLQQMSPTMLAAFLYLGAGVGMLLGERPGLQFYAALIIMAGSTVLLVRDTIALQHTHEHRHVHTHEHRHGDVIHTHEHEHLHTHLHVHGEDTALHDHSHAERDGHDHCHSFA